MNKARSWLFRGLVLVGLVGVVALWFASWWSMDADKVGKNVVQIFPFGLRTSLTPQYFALAHGAADLPAWFPPFAWAFFAALIVGLLLSMLWLADIKGRLVLAACGLGYFMTPVIMAVVASIKLKATGMPLQGEGYFTAGGYYNSTITTRLDPGWYAALGVGVFIILLALLRDRIIGKAKGAAQWTVEKAAPAGSGG